MQSRTAAHATQRIKKLRVIVLAQRALRILERLRLAIAMAVQVVMQPIIAASATETSSLASAPPTRFRIFMKAGQLHRGQPQEKRRQCYARKACIARVGRFAFLPGGMRRDAISQGARVATPRSRFDTHLGPTTAVTRASPATQEQVVSQMLGNRDKRSAKRRCGPRPGPPHR